MKSTLILTLAAILTLTTYKQSEAIPVPIPQCGGGIQLQLKLNPNDITEECKRNLQDVIKELPNVVQDDAKLKELLEEHGCGALYKSIRKQVRDAIRKHQQGGGGSCEA